MWVEFCERRITDEWRALRGIVRMYSNEFLQIESNAREQNETC